MRLNRSILSAFLVILLLLSPIFSACAGSPSATDETGSVSGEPSDSSEPSGTDSESESEPEESETEPAATVPETELVDTREYVAPEDRTFTILGTPLSDYNMMLCWQNEKEYDRMGVGTFKKVLRGITIPVLGYEMDLTVSRNDKFYNASKFDHEILFGYEFRREGIPEYDGSKSFYGVTENGTVYFCSPTVMLYPYMWQLFMEEFFGSPVYSGWESYGCNITEPVYREVPDLDHEALSAEGYSLVFEDEFDGPEINWDVWEIRHQRNIFSSSLFSIRDGCLILKGDYLDDGEEGAGWYESEIRLKQQYCRGVFEATILCSSCEGRGDLYGSAFWIQGPHPYEEDKSLGGPGEGGAELDIMENWETDFVSSGIFVNGFDDSPELDNFLSVVRGLGNNYQDSFHTFTLIWDETLYRTYVDGRLVMATNYGLGTATVPEEVILSICLHYANAEPPAEGAEYNYETVVDSLRIWQKQ